MLLFLQALCFQSVVFAFLLLGGLVCGIVVPVVPLLLIIRSLIVRVRGANLTVRQLILSEVLTHFVEAVDRPKS